ncbi:hypothetical protein C8J57DRAFT_446831 [Mycena rebaudengoi]|nr:hypothetical protein C8J57DRAFT_64500 [Mycena rebaudengoi]KAJ7263094.1 hypothetical protein C8J57DRAFT_446831 [Mycena rebaudengoi]
MVTPLPESTSDIQHASRSMDSELTLPKSGFAHADPLPLFPASPPPERGRAMDAPIRRLHTHSRAFSHSPQPMYHGALDTHHTHSDLGFYESSSRFDDGAMEPYFSHTSTDAVEDYLDASVIAAHFLDLPNHCSSGSQNSFAHSYPLSDTSASSPEATDTASSSSPRADVFSAHSSPGYRQLDLPDTARPHSGFGRRSQSSHFLDPYVHHALDNGYTLPRPASYHESAIIQRSGNTWNPYPVPSLPYISQSSRSASSRPVSPSTANAFRGMGHYPVPDDVRRWPQMFKINQVKKIGPKKQTMACLFCRERKIGCTRPAEDNPDQTCNQCARRKRICEYPTESRRGQHTRHRNNSKKLLAIDVATVSPPTLPASI